MYRQDISGRYICQAGEPAPQFAKVVGVHGVRHPALAVGHASARGLEPFARIAAPLDADDRVVDPVADRHGQAGGLGEVELEALDRWDEPAQRKDAGGPGAPRAQRERVRHYGTLREATEYRSFGGEPMRGEEGVEPGGGERIAGVERLRVRVADALDGVPVVAAGRQHQRAPGRSSQQPALWIELVEQGKEIVLVDAAPVQQHQRGGGLALWWPDAMDQRVGAAPSPASSRSRTRLDCVSNNTGQARPTSAPGLAPDELAAWGGFLRAHGALTKALDAELI